jgi:pimeloyl-ACP methyl ester carboxylesterase
MTIFIHGLESSNQGTKSIFFREQFPGMLIPHFTGGLSQRMDKLHETLEGMSDIAIVGSSFGGLMASLFAMSEEPRVNRLILLAPALNFIELSGYNTKAISTPVWIYHGKDDDVIPLLAVEDVAGRLFTNLCFNKVDDDHFLHKTFKHIDWTELLTSGDAGCLNRE